MDLLGVLAATTVLIALGALALAGWCVWLLHKHWPRPDWVAAKEQMQMIFSAYTKGREAVPVREALESMAAELAAAKQRAVMTRDAESFIAEHAATDKQDMETPVPVGEFGTNLQTGS